MSIFNVGLHNIWKNIIIAPGEDTGHTGKTVFGLDWEHLGIPQEELE